MSVSFRILIADDHEVVRRGIRSLFELRSDWEICAEAVDGRDAVEKAKQLKPDLIVMDVGMPRLNGLEAARILRRELPHSDVLIVSQLDAAHMREQALEAGARDYVAKSDLARDLLAAVERIIELRGSTKAGPALAGSSRRGHATSRPAECLTGGGEMGKLMRAKDWSKTSLGPVENWPQSLKTSVSICLNSRFAILVWWGPDLIMLYNDAYRQIIGSKHPFALGSPGREVWHEIWETIGPMLQNVLRQSEATWSDDLMLLLERYEYPEECYFTFSYSPIRDETGGVGGVFTPVTETTDSVIGERRLRTLRDLAARSAGKKSETEAWKIATEVLAQNPYDIPFAVIYRLDQTGRKATAVAYAEISSEHPFCPEEICLDEANSLLASWLAEAVTGVTVEASQIADQGFDLPGNTWGIAARDLIILPLTQSAQDQPFGVLVAGVSPRKLLDEGYRTFFNLVAGQLANGIAEIEAYEQERNRVAALQLAHDDLEGRVTERTAELEKAERSLRALSGRLLQSQDHERRRIARELHDSAGQLLTALSMNLIPLERKLENSGAELIRPVRESISLVEELSKELRTISHLLHPPLLDEAGLPSALRWYVGGFAERSKIPVHLELGPNLGRLTRDLETTIFRVVQECLTNIHRHSESTTAKIRFTRDSKNVRVEIRDQGKGMPPSTYGAAPGPTRPGMGIQGMRERVRQVGGRLDIHSSNRGTRVIATLPALDAASEDRPTVVELIS